MFSMGLAKRNIRGSFVARGKRGVWGQQSDEICNSECKREVAALYPFAQHICQLPMREIKGYFMEKTPLSDWLVDTLRFSGVDHFCFLQFATQKTARERCWACATSLTQTSPCPTRWSLSTTPYHQLDLWRTLESQSTTIVWKYTFKDTHHHQQISNIQSTILLLTAFFYSSTDDKVQLCRWQEYNCDC